MIINHQNEIKCQYECLKIMSHNNIDEIENLIKDDILPILLRKIITKIEQKYNRVPEAKELTFIVIKLINKE